MFILRRNSLELLLSEPAGNLGFKLMEGSIVLLVDLFYEMYKYGAGSQKSICRVSRLGENADNVCVRPSVYY